MWLWLWVFGSVCMGVWHCIMYVCVCVCLDQICVCLDQICDGQFPGTMVSWPLNISAKSVNAWSCRFCNLLCTVTEAISCLLFPRLLCVPFLSGPEVEFPFDGRCSSMVRVADLYPKTLGSIPWQGRVRDSFSVSLSQLLCRLVCVWSPFVCMAHTHLCAHVTEVENVLLLAHRANEIWKSISPQKVSLARDCFLNCCEEHFSVQRTVELYILSLSQWARVEEKERRQTGVLNSASFSHKDFVLHTSPLGFPLRWSKSPKKFREIAEGKITLTPMG